MTMTGDGLQFDWAVLVPQVLHPLKVAIIEAISYIGHPLSPTELHQVLDHQAGLSLVAYHVRRLAQAGALVETGHREVRGARETFYFLRPGTGRRSDRRDARRP